MIDCPNGEIRDRLPDFVHDQLSGVARAEVAAHVAACGACAAEVALLRDLRGSLRVAPSVDVSRIVAALPAPRPATGGARPIERPARRRVDWRVAAAVAALAVGGGSAVMWGPKAERPGAGSARVAQQPPGRGDSVTSDAGVQRVAAVAVSIDADLGEVSDAELERLLRDLDSFDGLPAGEPEPALRAPGDSEPDR